ncbi:hypothetical protein [Candidatus Nitrospira bockiana]
MPPKTRSGKSASGGTRRQESGRGLSTTDAPTFRMRTTEGMPMGVDVSTEITGNPSATPNADAGGPSSTENIGDHRSRSTEPEKGRPGRRPAREER